MFQCHVQSLLILFYFCFLCNSFIIYIYILFNSYFYIWGSDTRNLWKTTENHCHLSTQTWADYQVGFLPVAILLRFLTVEVWLKIIIVFIHKICYNFFILILWHYTYEVWTYAFQVEKLASEIWILMILHILLQYNIIWQFELFLLWHTCLFYVYIYYAVYVYYTIIYIYIFLK